MAQHEYKCQSCFHRDVCPEYHPETYRCEHHLDEASVAPRAEVELWKGRPEAVFAAIPETRREFARKIFEEIERIIQKNYESAQDNEEDEELEAATDYMSYISYDLEELKKKYTEAEPPKGE